MPKSRGQNVEKRNQNHRTVRKPVFQVKRNSHWRCSVRNKVFLKISQNLHENTCSRVSLLIKLQAVSSATRCFPVDFEKVLGTSFLQNTSAQLLLSKQCKF